MIRERGIPVVREAWLLDSIEKQEAQPLSAYDVMSDLAVEGRGIPWDKQDPSEEALESISAEVWTGHCLSLAMTLEMVLSGIISYTPNVTWTFFSWCSWSCMGNGPSTKTRSYKSEEAKYSRGMEYCITVPFLFVIWGKDWTGMLNILQASIVYLFSSFHYGCPYWRVIRECLV